MNYLLDTQILLWALQNSPKLSQKARSIITNPNNALYFSSVSTWEVAIKLGRGYQYQHQYQNKNNDNNTKNLKENSYTEGLVEPKVFYQTLLQNDYLELNVTSLHASAVIHLPNIHKDPFDRMLIAQARIKNLTLMTVDAKVICYGECILSV